MSNNIKTVLTDAQIDAAAQSIAESFDYPWQHMPEEGRRNMRHIARKAIDAAIAANADKGEL